MSISTDGAAVSYNTNQKEFIKYFERLKETGMTFDEIEKKLPQLENYYFEMVLEGSIYMGRPKLNTFFEIWKQNR